MSKGLTHQVSPGDHSTQEMDRSAKLSSDSGPVRHIRLRASDYQGGRKSDSVIDFNYKPAPFTLRWINGYNPRVNVINLNHEGSTILFYAAANCGVLYNWTARQMKILQGHKHMVTFIAADAAARWLVTADSGPENIITIWETRSIIPYKTIFSPHGYSKLAKLAFSADAKFLLTMAYSEKAVLHWWIWTEGLNQPHAIKEVTVHHNSVINIKFNPADSTQFILVTKHELFIGVSGKRISNERGEPRETDEYELKVKLVDNTAGPEFGRVSCFTFVANTCQILTATTKGAILVYGYTLEYSDKAVPMSYDKLKFVKVVKVEKYHINVICSVDNMIVTGNEGGEVRFYDEHLLLLYWLHGCRPDAARWLSFNLDERSYELVSNDSSETQRCPCWESVVRETDPATGAATQRLVSKRLPTDATTAARPFLVRDFVLCTKNQGIGFVDFVTERMTTILDCRPAHAVSLSVHPEKPLVCTGYADGTIELFNFEERTLFARLNLRELFTVTIHPKKDSIKVDIEVIVPTIHASCLQYSPSGLHLACGLSNGELVFLDPTTITMMTEKPFKDTSYSIKQIAYSPDSLTLAMADAGKTVSVYQYDCETFAWSFIGKHRGHYKDIARVLFLPQMNPNGTYKLLSIGHDRIMVEYDVGESREGVLEIYSLDRFEQTAVPLDAIVWPNVNKKDGLPDMPTVLLANDEYKYKIVNHATTMTLATYLGPRYDAPVCKLRLTSRTIDNVENCYLIFATKKAIGLQKLPLDGNPWKHCGILAHPNQITEMCFRDDLETLFMIGEKDPCLLMWRAKYSSPERTTEMGGAALEPYYCLVEGGRPGWLFQEIRDLFYYIQILCQGTFSPAPRAVRDRIPVDSLPDLMRALGYYPSEFEVDNLLTEARYNVTRQSPATDVDFEDFVKLYLNHRPALGDHFQKLRTAFKYFASCRDGQYVLSREALVDALCSYGECFCAELAGYLLSVVHGASPDDQADPEAPDFSFLPEELTFSEFIYDLLGVQGVDIPEVQSVGADSVVSQTTSHNASHSTAESIWLQNEE
ncbi:unnamed protein product [Plutella xylostella]|uniref:Cilia- and flagella-associated protein 251 n=1 Tax=Plutella xylostella TaxID=51655 RepID=A0A8S4DD94_PLUXY|nr:unnamed protein product [Plutella xylostella]